MADGFPYNESYKHRYVVVATSPGQVILRPKDSSLLDRYWKEFISAEIPAPAEPKNMQLKISSVPSPVRKIDAFTPYDLEYPKVVLTDGDTEVDISKYVSASKPDPQTPGFYKVEYVLPLPGMEGNVVWQTYLSIEEPPVLRHVITPWNRESYTIATLNRLIIEPQFQEALYEEGAPFYNFVTSNMSPALRPGTARECYNCLGFKTGKHLFVSGHKLPLATSIELDSGPGSSFEVHLDRTVNASAWASAAYSKGSVVQQNKKIYCATTDMRASDIPGSAEGWLEGYLYSLQEAVPPDGARPGTPEYEATSYYRWSISKDGEVELLAVWAPVDLRGYIFSVDVKHAPQLGTYWGYYDKKYFKDYRPGDLVSYISDDVLYLYRRNDTDIRDLSTEEAYRPGSYQNPHWDEVYAAWEESQLRALGRWIRPISNAGNALIAKTCSLSEEICSTFAYILGIPDALVEAIGSKCSVFLYVLLQRTRNTFEGFRNAFRAIGLSVDDLHRVYPTVSAAGADGEDFKAIYPAEDTLKRISMALRYDLLWETQPGDDVNAPPTPINQVYSEDSVAWQEINELDLHWIRYWPNPRYASGRKGRTYYAIQEYRGATWKTIYEVTGFGDDQSAANANDRVKGNNRYYRASLSLLDRLASQALIDMRDDKQWIDLNAFSEISTWLADLMRYEVPIYIYLILSVNVASIDEMWLAGRGMRRVHFSAQGGTPTLVVHPSRYFDLATCSTKEVYASLQVLGDNGWEDVEPTSMRDGSAVYDFDKAVTVRFVLDMDTEIKGYWTSRHTMGMFGDNSTDTPVDASEMGEAEELHLVNGITGVTPLLPTGSLVGEFDYLKYNYILSDDGTPWKFDEETPFGGYSSTDGLEVFATWMEPLAMFTNAVAKVTDRDGAPIRYNIQSVGMRVMLEVFGGYPEEIYIYGKQGNCLALIRPPKDLPYRVDPKDAFGNAGEYATMRILLDKE